MIRVAFILAAGRNWLGGYNYIRNLVCILKRFSEHGIEPVLFISEAVATDRELARISGKHDVNVIVSNVFDEATSPRSIATALILGRNKSVQKILIDNSIDVVFESAMYFGWNLGVPAVAWIPDFQHRRLRHLFNWRSYWKRELGFQMQIRSGRTIMLSSNDAAGDCSRYYPASQGRTHVVSFAVQMPVGIEDIDAKALRERYDLPARYFYLPNQFWGHKNHKVVISALGLISNVDKRIVIATSGGSADVRNPTLFEEMKSMVARQGLNDRFLFLGMVPYNDLLALMYNAVAVINPSLFEGWSTTVEEAKALGVPLVLSEIAVHREQVTSNVSWFDPNSPERCGSALLEAMKMWGHRVRAADSVLKEANDISLNEYAKKFSEVVNSALDECPIS